MANDFRFEDGAPAAKGTSGSSNNCLVTCLIIFGVLFAILIVAGGFGAWYLSRNWKSMASSFATEALSQAIDDVSEFTDEQKAELKSEVARVGKAFAEGRLSEEKLGRLVEQLAKSPILTSFIVNVIEKQYINRSGLDDEEKIAGHRTLQRFSRGWVEGKIKEDDFDDVLQHVADRKPDGDWTIRNTLTDEELRKFLAEAKAKADAEGIPDEDYEVDPAKEFRRLVDEALADDPRGSKP